MPALSVALSQTLVAFTIEFDNEFEHRMSHRTADRPDRRGVWLTSMAMWSNFIRLVPDDGIPLASVRPYAQITNLLPRRQLTGQSPPTAGPARSALVRCWAWLIRSATGPPYRGFSGWPGRSR